MPTLEYYGVSYQYTGAPVFSFTLSPNDWVWIVRAELAPGESVHARRERPGSPVRSELRTREVVAVSHGTDYKVEAKAKRTSVCNYDINGRIEVYDRTGNLIEVMPACAPPAGCPCEEFLLSTPRPIPIEPLSIAVAEEAATFELDSMYKVTVSAGTQLRITDLDGAYHILGEGLAGQIRIISMFSGFSGREEHAPALKPFVLGTQASQWVIGLPYNQQEPLQSVSCGIQYETFQEDEQTLYRVRGTIDMDGAHLWQRAGEEDVRIERHEQADVPEYVQALSGGRQNLKLPSTCFVEVME